MPWSIGSEISRGHSEGLIERSDTLYRWRWSEDGQGFNPWYARRVKVRSHGDQWLLGSASGPMSLDPNQRIVAGLSTYSAFMIVDVLTSLTRAVFERAPEQAEADWFDGGWKTGGLRWFVEFVREESVYRPSRDGPWGSGKTSGGIVRARATDLTFEYEPGRRAAVAKTDFDEHLVLLVQLLKAYHQEAPHVPWNR